ncbi:hypothetical protein JG688_00010661 [Phytophthora aleatoria]|uniref:Uncharacterized protein n=1 Tax=Phytophthora aleatoria TaxID=2496075 RepID=A0A8J5ILM2_9STRA|nr:hypothetical protein JG688_00010661 [Phytophthora aleatoria]
MRGSTDCAKCWAPRTCACLTCQIGSLALARSWSGSHRHKKLVWATPVHRAL